MNKTATNSKMMLDMIKEVIDAIVMSETEVEFYTLKSIGTSTQTTN